MWLILVAGSAALAFLRWGWLLRRCRCGAEFASAAAAAKHRRNAHNDN